MSASGSLWDLLLLAACGIPSAILAHQVAPPPHASFLDVVISTLTFGASLVFFVSVSLLFLGRIP